MMQRSPAEPMAFSVSEQVVDSVEDRGDGELELDETSQGSDAAGGQHISASELSAEEQEDGELVHEDEGTEDDAVSTPSSVSSVGRSSRVSDGTTSTSSSHDAEAGRPMANLSCRLCSEDGSAPEEPLFRCPCRCSDTFVHRSCLEQLLYQGPEGAVCPVCDAHYPVRRRTKPLWLWFWDEESREDATLFMANLVFSLGNIGVLTMAWMYVLFEYRTKSWLPTASLASALFVLSVLWVAFGCLRFHVLLMSLVRWRRANTTLKVLLTDKTVAQA